MRPNTRPMEGLQVRSRSPKWGVVLVAGGILLASGALLIAGHALDRRSDALAERISADETRRVIAAAAARTRTVAPLTEAAAAQFGQQVRMINRDWTRLLKSLVPETDDIRLLSVDVDPSGGTVRLSGASDTAERANAYSALLEKRAVVSDVRLLTVEPDGNRTGFEVTARWAN